MGGTEILRHGKNRRNVARYSVYRGTHISSRAGDVGGGRCSVVEIFSCSKILFITSIFYVLFTVNAMALTPLSVAAVHNDQD